MCIKYEDAVTRQLAQQDWKQGITSRVTRSEGNEIHILAPLKLSS